MALGLRALEIFARMSDRARIIEKFLEGQGYGAARRTPLAGDASFRRYERLFIEGGEGEESIVLMDAPPPMEDVRPFVAVAERLNRFGFSAPEIIAADTENGLLLIEDFGDQTYTEILKTDPGKEHDLYALAVDFLIALHRQPVEKTAAGFPSYDVDRLQDEHAQFINWYYPEIIAAEIPSSGRKAYLDLWRQLLDGLPPLPQVLVLRDFHVDNLMLLPGRDGISACGLLDFQDAVAGSCVYDLVSLLGDARRDVPVDIVGQMKARYLDAFPELDRQAFEAAYAVFSAQRNCKILGIFVRLCVRDRKCGYFEHIPRLWRLLEESLRHPVLAPLDAWMAEYFPAEYRAPPDCRFPS